MITVSIIIPTLNRAESLRNTLRSILELADLSETEVIVVDNGSTDNTPEVFRHFSTYERITSSYYYDPEPGLLTGRHRGTLAAKGSILCFLDDDVELDRTWLQGVRSAFNDQEVQLATGPCLPKYQVTPPEWLKYFWVDAYHGKYCYWLSLIDLGDKKVFTHPNYVLGLNFCIRKKALFSLGGFHPDCIPSALQMFQGDGETGLTTKAFRQNYKSLYHPDIKLFHVITSERLTVAYFRKRAFYQGICNSFSQLKEQYTGLSVKKLGLRSTGQEMLRRIRTTVASYRQKALPLEVRELKAHFKFEETRGYMFHQHAYQNDEKVKGWVHKNDYWNYKLPD